MNEALPTDVHKVKVELANGLAVDATITCSYRDDPAHAGDVGVRWGFYGLKLETPNSSYTAESQSDYFEAMVELRRQVDALGIKLLCFGARRDVWPSKMARDMGEGLKAYLLSAPVEGREALHSIFEYAPPETIGTVEEQAKYAEAWLKRKN